MNVETVKQHPYNGLVRHIDYWTYAREQVTRKDLRT